MNYYEIADYNPISEDFVIPAEFVPIRRYSPETVLSSAAIAKFQALGFELREVQMFTTPPQTTTRIHIDGNEFTSKSAINYVVNGPGLMKWYKLANKSNRSKTTEAGTVYMPFEPEDCVEIDQLAITKLTLVEVCQPHNIVNDTSNYRYCFSIRYNNVSDFSSTREKIKAWT
jgi:hypothetical protein